MSLQSATEFMNAIAANPTLMSEIAAATVGKNPAETALTISALGKREGFDFTADEATATRQAFLAELSEGDLDKVAGGVNDGGAAGIGAGFIAGELAGQVIPIGGGIIGAGVGAGVGAAMGGASASDALAAGAMGAAQNMADTKSAVQQFFSGW
jgi:predicted ribosomally synthesized peptide with nif11-like leader